MESQELKRLLTIPECDYIDYKRQNYRLEKEDDIASFVKDIISFSNTIRLTSAFILIGVEELDGKRIVIGADKYYDDATLQEKCKDKIFPKPHFQSSIVTLNGLDVGVIEIYAKKVVKPLMPTQKLKGLIPGKVYLRRGSSNQEADSHEIIAINDWLQTLPDPTLNLIHIYSDLLLKFTSSQNTLSTLLVEGLRIAREISDEKLTELFHSELKGYSSTLNLPTDFQYRTVRIPMSWKRVDGSATRMNSAQELIQALRREDGFTDRDLVLLDSVTDIETQLQKLEHTKTTNFVTLPMKGDKFGFESTITIYAYTIYETWQSVYMGIKQKIVSELVDRIKS